MSTSLVGQKLGKYQVTEQLGQGGMATVYKAYQPEIDRYVAVKVLPQALATDEQFVKRFRLEARTIARLQHPHILPLYDYGDENGILYLVMAYADGGSLADRIRRGAIPLPEIEHIFDEVASALDYAHRQNVVHRDIKPDNILIDHEGHSLLSDFGIVKLLENSSGATATLTESGGIVGTPAYMSPEQAQGLPLAPQSDIYSLGIVIYEMIVGAQPFSAETPMQIAIKHITTPVPPLFDSRANLPAVLDTVMQHALTKDPDQRYASVRDFFADFQRVLHGEQPKIAATAATETITEDALPPILIRTAPESAVQPPPPPTQAAAPATATMVASPASNPLILLGGFAVIALLVVSVVFLVLNANDAPPAEAPTAPPTVAAVAVEPTATSRSVAALPVENANLSVGTISYSSANAPGDTVQVKVNELAQPPADLDYYLWLYNTASAEALALGSVRLDPMGDGQLTFTADAGGMLPAHYNAVLITQQDAASDAPAGEVAYHGAIPAEVMTALDAILVSSPDGIPSGDSTSSLLAGAIQEARIAKQHAGLAAGASSAGSMHSHAEHTINILQGTQEDYNGNGRGENPGRGYGIPYFLDRIEAQLSAISAAPDADNLMDSQIELIRVCIVNARGWMNEIVDRESQFFTVEDIDSVQTQLQEASDYAAALLDGIDLNQNGRVEPFEGECGLAQIDTFGIAVGNLRISAGALPETEE